MTAHPNQENNRVRAYAGIETEKDSSAVISECLEKGVLVLKAKDKVRLLPPLNISMEELEKAVAVLKEACAV